MISKDINGNEYEVALADLTWRPSAYGIIIRDEKILLVKVFGKYHLPGGGVELGEDPVRAVIREVEEETGILIVNPDLVDAESSFFTWGDIDVTKGLTHVQSLLLYYACDFKGGKLGNTKLDEYEKLADLTAEWVEVSKLNQILMGSTVDWRPVVNRVLHNLQTSI